jgi:hypothetical protein
MIAFLRSIGYSSATSVGWAYSSSGDFEAHGWVEVKGDSSYSFDPTWAEYPVDATHIKFASLPDSVFNLIKIESRGQGDFSAKIGDITTDIVVLDMTEDSLVESESLLLDNKLWYSEDGSYAVLKTSIEADGCIFTDVASGSCLTGVGKEFLKTINPEDAIWFCNQRDYFTIFEVPNNLDPLMDYNCPLSILISADLQTNDTVFLTRSEAPVKSVSLEYSAESLKAGEEYSATSNGLIFTSYGASGEGALTDTIPSSDFTLYSYLDGSLASAEIEVSADIGEPVEVKVVEEEEEKFNPFQRFINALKRLFGSLKKPSEID